VPIKQLKLAESYPNIPEVVEHLRLVSTGGLLEGKVQFTHGGFFMHVYGLSNAGHELLNSIRDEGIWKSTKEKIAVVDGTVANGIAKAKLGL
jgi:hypothetical protein